MTGIFISFEGGEGAGKTSVVEKLVKPLEDYGLDFITTREPGGILIAERIREIILDPTHTEMDGRTEALLYAAARRQHLVERVLPQLAAGKVVLCDRFIDSSLVYQGIARNIGFEEVMAINAFAIDNCMPQLTFYYDIKPEEGLKRIAENVQREMNRLDQESLDFHYKVREGYKKLIEMFPNRIVSINAEQTLDEVVKETLEKLLAFISSHQKGKE